MTGEIPPIANQVEDSPEDIKKSILDAAKTERTLHPRSKQEKLTQDQLDAMVDLHVRFLSGRLGGRRAILQNIDISGLSLAGKDMRQIDFSGCSMLRMDLSGTNFQEARLYACDLSGANLEKCNFIRADLRGSRIEFANLEKANLDKADLRVGGVARDGDAYNAAQSVNFRGANLSGAKLTGVLGGNADFSDAIMANVNMMGADLRDAKMEGADLSGAKIGGANLHGAQLKAAILTGVDLTMLKERDADLSEAITDANIGASLNDLDEPLAQKIETHRNWVDSAGKEGAQLDLSGYDLRSLEKLKQERLTAIKAVKARFFGMNLYQIQMQSATLDDADFRRCDLEESDLRGSSFKGARFNHANLRAANFSPLLFGAGEGTKRFSPSDFEDASLSYADFEGANLRSANFKGANLSYANFLGADLNGADFTDAILDNTNFDGADLEDTTMEIPKGSVFKLDALSEDG